MPSTSTMFQLKFQWLIARLLVFHGTNNNRPTRPFAYFPNWTQQLCVHNVPFWEQCTTISLFRFSNDTSGRYCQMRAERSRNIIQRVFLTFYGKMDGALDNPSVSDGPAFSSIMHACIKWHKFRMKCRMETIKISLSMESAGSFIIGRCPPNDSMERKTASYPSPTLQTQQQTNFLDGNVCYFSIFFHRISWATAFGQYHWWNVNSIQFTVKSCESVDDSFLFVFLLISAEFDFISTGVVFSNGQGLDKRPSIGHRYFEEFGSPMEILHRLMDVISWWRSAKCLR